MVLSVARLIACGARQAANERCGAEGDDHDAAQHDAAQHGAAQHGAAQHGAAAASAGQSKVGQQQQQQQQWQQQQWQQQPLEDDTSEASSCVLAVPVGCAGGAGGAAVTKTEPTAAISGSAYFDESGDPF